MEDREWRQPEGQTIREWAIFNPLSSILTSIVQTTLKDDGRDQPQPTPPSGIRSVPPRFNEGKR